MNEWYSIGAYWGDRQESINACAMRVSRLLTELSHCSDEFARWFRPGKTLHDALAHEITSDVEQLITLLNARRNRRDTDSGVIESLGLSVSLWNGGSRGRAIGLNVCCGLHAETAELLNSCVISFHKAERTLKELLTVPKLEQIITSIVKAFEPDWGAVTSAEIRDRVIGDGYPARKPKPGWMLYLQNRRGQIPPLPPPAYVKSVRGFGNLIIATDQIVSAEREDQIEQLRMVKTILDHHSLLAPIPLKSQAHPTT